MKIVRPKAIRRLFFSVPFPAKLSWVVSYLFLWPFSVPRLLSYPIRVLIMKAHGMEGCYAEAVLSRTYLKSESILFLVIPAKAGIQVFQASTGPPPSRG